MLHRLPAVVQHAQALNAVMSSHVLLVDVLTLHLIVVFVFQDTLEMEQPALQVVMLAFLETHLSMVWPSAISLAARAVLLNLQQPPVQHAVLSLRQLQQILVLIYGGMIIHPSLQDLLILCLRLMNLMHVGL
jgi:hypothetical protein